jgi:hypothetical protein
MMADDQLDIGRHNRVLLHALQTAHPMLRNGLQCFIHTLVFQAAGGGIETIVYLRGGRTGEVPAHELTLDTTHNPAGTIGAVEATSKTDKEQSCTE